MKVARFYSEGELSGIRVSSAEETVLEINHLFAEEEKAEAEIVALIRQFNELGENSGVDELRLDFKRIYNKKEIQSKTRFGFYRFADSAHYKGNFSIQTILSIKGEERYLSARFRNYMVLRSRFGSQAEPYLFASLKNGYFYLLNAEEIASRNFLVSSVKTFAAWIQKKISFRTSTK